MEHKGSKVIESENLILRPFKAEDAHDMFINWASDPEVTKYLTWKAYENEFDAESYCSARSALADMPQIYDWIIELKENHQAIGSISLLDINERYSSCEIGYCLSRKYWNRGIMTEAVGKILGFAFDELGIYRVCGKCAVENIASARVMEKCGMTLEGISRGSVISSTGKRCDCKVYSLILTDRQ